MYTCEIRNYIRTKGDDLTYFEIWSKLLSSPQVTGMSTTYTSLYTLHTIHINDNGVCEDIEIKLKK